MQTFLPYPSFVESVKCLDNKRLGKQRVEARQILKTLEQGGGWANHPAVKMWRGYEDALEVYADSCIIEWMQRGFKNTMPLSEFRNGKLVQLPHWFFSSAFHASHRSNLLRKMPEHYKQFGWTEPDNLSYVWPVS